MAKRLGESESAARTVDCRDLWAIEPERTKGAPYGSNKNSPVSYHPEAGRHFWGKASVIWPVQMTLAITVLFAGAAKLFGPANTLDDSPFAPWFLRTIGFFELLAAFGLILPGALRFQRWLTPLAATGLVLIMAGAVVTEVSQGRAATAITPLMLGLMAAFIAWQRRDWLSAGDSPVSFCQAGLRSA